MSFRKLIDTQIDLIVEDMYKFVEENPDWNTPSEPHTSPSDSLELQRCGMYPKCKNYCLDEAYKRYGVCSSECDLKASVAEDRVQDG